METDSDHLNTLRVRQLPFSVTSFILQFNIYWFPTGMCTKTVWQSCGLLKEPYGTPTQSHAIPKETQRALIREQNISSRTAWFLKVCEKWPWIESDLCTSSKFTGCDLSTE